MGIPILRHSWTVQPPTPAGIKPYWIDRGLVFASLGNGVFWTPKTGFIGPTTVVGGPKSQGGIYGISKGFGATVGTGTTDRIDPPSIPLPNTGVRSFIAFVYPRTVGGGNFGRVINAFGSSGADTVVGETSYVNNTTNKLLYVHTTSATAYAAGINGTVSLNTWSCFGFTHDMSLALTTLPTCYENGVVSSSTSFAGTPSGTLTTGTYTPCIGNRNTDSLRNWDGFLGPLFIFQHPSKGITADEQASIYRNPWQIFSPRERQILVPSSGAVTHDTSGALTGQGSAIAGTAAHIAKHETSGSLVGQGATIAGVAERVGAATTHETSGVLVGSGSSITGEAATIRIHVTSGDIVGAGSSISGVADNPSGIPDVLLAGAGYPVIYQKKKKRKPRIDDIIGVSLEDAYDELHKSASEEEVSKAVKVVSQYVPDSVEKLGIPDAQDIDWAALKRDANSVSMLLDLLNEAIKNRKAIENRIALEKQIAQEEDEMLLLFLST